MTPWLLITVLLAGINLLGLLAILGRWGRMVLALAMAALLGTALGNAVGALTGLELLRLGDYHVVAASVGAQLAMLATLLLAALLPGHAADR
ncbi:MAG TPA: hypothetical protein VIA82_00325 [Candidatus Limnocylindria bacterium]